MEIPAPLLNGSITYLVLTLLACCAGVGMGITGKLSRENSSYVSFIRRLSPCAEWLSIDMFCGDYFASLAYLRCWRS